jgi:hypothetical protein
MHPLLEKQQQLHNEASQLLKEIVLPFLEDFGEVRIGGSYAFQLLNHPDVDIDLINPDLSKELYSELCKRFISLGGTSQFKTTDRVNFPHNHPGNRPTGYWIAPDIQYGEHIWNLDIWFQKPEWYTGKTNAFLEKMSNITDEQKILILSMKEEAQAKNMYGIGKEFRSVDIYDGVLLENIATFSDLQGYESSNR